MKTVQISARRFVQMVFLSAVVFIGMKFYLFVLYLEKGIIPGFERPAGVEAFLPISALVSLKHWLYTGTINKIHPSALILFLMICFTAFFVKKGFCSWACPIGLLSEYLAKLHSYVFKKDLRLPYFLDLLLRTFKYLIAGFFIYQIFYRMPIDAVDQFIQSPYNRFADITMLRFFTQISTTAFMVIIGLIVLSIFIQNLWCRYLCPYGALLGIIGFFSLGKIRRNQYHCTGCGKCEKACPGNIAIRQKTGINSLECSACLTCVETCPEKDVIKYSMLAGKKPISSFIMALFFLFFFTNGIVLAMLTGNWQNGISKNEYLSYLAPIKHEGNSIGPISPEKMQKMILMMQQLKEQQIHIKESQNNMGD